MCVCGSFSKSFIIKSIMRCIKNLSLLKLIFNLHIINQFLVFTNTDFLLGSQYSCLHANIVNAIHHVLSQCQLHNTSDS